jgi:hypothetical protein
MTSLQSLVPLTLWPEPAFPIVHKWSLINGVSLVPLKAVLREQIKSYTKSLPYQSRSDHTFALIVDHDLFVSAANKRFNNCLLDPETLNTHQIAKAFLLAATLTNFTTFRIGIEFTGRPLIDSSIFRPMASTFYEDEQIYLYRRLSISSLRQPSVFKPRAFKAKIISIEKYFIGEKPIYDRVGAAITHLWSSLCTPYPEQALLSVCAGLEALTVGEDKGEITYKISERLAFLLGKNPRYRLHVFREVKYVYGMRSLITHGEFYKNRKPDEAWHDALIITPRRVFSGQKALQIGTKLLCAALNHYLSESTILQACAEKKHKQAIDNYFENLIFRQKITQTK